MSRGSTAKKVRDLTNYGSEVVLLHLSKQVKKGGITTNFVIVARAKPISGMKNTTVWLSDKDGKMAFIEPIQEFYSKDIAEAAKTLGYTLV